MLLINTFLCLAIILRIVLFVRTGEHRLPIAIIAYLITVAAGADIILRWYHVVEPATVTDLFFKLLVCVALYRSKGNVAKLLFLKRRCSNKLTAKPKANSESKKTGDNMKLRIGSKGHQVKDLQKKLNANGANLVVDGWFGEATANAVLLFQTQQKLPATGYAGVRTLAVLDGENREKYLSERDILFAATTLQLTPAIVAAVAEVESNGCGFFECGRPAILFERHVFYRLLSKKDKAAAEELAEKYPNICNEKPGGYTGGSGEYQRLSIAYLLDPEAAICACSWGMFQIMGYHFEALGFASAAEFKTAMEQSEGQQLQALAKFINSDNNMHKALKGLKWADFAKRYNGPAYKRNLYDAKLAEAHKEMSEIYTLEVLEESSNVA